MKIKAAAILFDGKIYEGKRHYAIGLELIKSGACCRPFPGGDAQGFVTDCGRFVSREEAMDIAIRAGQVKDGKTVNPRRLFSEDLW